MKKMIFPKLKMGSLRTSHSKVRKAITPNCGRIIFFVAFSLAFWTAFAGGDTRYSKETDDDFYMELDKPVPVTDVKSILFKKTSLPCDAKPSRKNDAIFMVLWFKDTDLEPIYSFDTRNGKNPNQVRLWSSAKAFGHRAVFKVNTDPAQLLVENVQIEDEATYKCRVDFRNSPTKVSKTNLTVIVLPNRPIIYDSMHKEVETVSDAYNEGAILNLSCEVTGGRPPPRVHWYLENHLIDDTFYRRSTSTVNVLTDIVLRADMLNAQLNCVANNTPLAQPQTKLVLLNINLKPRKVEIVGKESRTFSVERGEYEVECVASGSRPTAHITWTIADRQIKRVTLKFPNEENKVISVAKFEPRAEDDGKELICTADNPLIPSSAIEDRWTLQVHYPPTVTLKLGHNLNPKSIKEGDDVYFECSVMANPKPFRLVWYLNGEEVHHNVSAGVIVAEKSLVLQKVSKEGAGNYACLAVNSEGKGVSNAVLLRIMYSPSCKISQNQVTGALKEETVSLKCEVDANPKPIEFHWTFNNSGDSSLISSSRYSQSGYLSIINYTPASETDYGTLACWARNSVGRQKNPCLFQIVSAGPPAPVKNCTINNQTDESILIECQSGHARLPQSFQMELIELPNLQSRYNVTVTSEPPSFYLEGIQSSSAFRVRIVAINVKGVSPPVYLETGPFKRTAKYLSSSSSIQVENILTGVASLLCAVLVVLCLFGAVLTFIRWRNRKQMCASAQEVAPNVSSSKEEETSPYAQALLVNNNVSPRRKSSKGPDIINSVPGNPGSAPTPKSENLLSSEFDDDQSEFPNNATFFPFRSVTKYSFDENGTLIEPCQDPMAVPALTVEEDPGSSSKYVYSDNSGIGNGAFDGVYKQDTFVVSSTMGRRKQCRVVPVTSELEESCI